MILSTLFFIEMQNKYPMKLLLPFSEERLERRRITIRCKTVTFVVSNLIYLLKFNRSSNFTNYNLFYDQWPNKFIDWLVSPVIYSPANGCF